MKFKIGVIFVTVVFLSCAISPKKITGKYCCMSRMEFKLNFPFKKAGTAIGVELELFSDSTFEYKDCSNIYRGNWKTTVNQERLLLKANKYHGRSEVVGKDGGDDWKEVGSEFQFIIRKNNILVDTFRGEPNPLLVILTKCQ